MLFSKTSTKIEYKPKTMPFIPLIIISMFAMIRFDLTLIVIANLIKSTNNNPYIIHEAV